MIWLIDLIGKLQRLVELGDLDDDLAREVFSRDVFTTFFQQKEHLKMSKAGDAYGKCSKERMEEILRRLEEMRSDANIMDKERVRKEKDNGSGEGTGDGSGSRGHLTKQTPYKDLPPVPNKDGRICKQLEKRRGQTNLFLNHLRKFTNGFPKFKAKSQEERLKVCKETQI